MTAEKKPFPVMINEYIPQIQMALPEGMDAKRLARAALSAYNSSNDIAECEVISIFASVIQCAQVGLELGFLGHAYLIPYKGRCTFVPGWKGLIDLVNRTGQAQAWTGAVYDGDTFDFDLGARPDIRHKQGKWTGNKDALMMTYSVGWMKTGLYPNIEVWEIDKVRAHLKKWNKVGGNHYALKNDGANWEMYARKVPLLQVLKYLRASSELGRAMHMNDMAEIGRQRFARIEDAVEGIILPGNDDDDAGNGGRTGNVAGTVVSRPPPEPQFFSSEAFEKNKGKWKENIAAGRLKVDDLQTRIPKETPFTAEQLKELQSAAKGREPPPPPPLAEREPGSDDK